MPLPLFIKPAGFGAVVANATILELLFNGSNGSTTFTDSSIHNRTITGYGNAQISTAQSVSGGASLLLDGSGDYLDFTWNTPLTGDFTLSVDIHPTTISSNSNQIFSIRGGTSVNLFIEIVDSSGLIRAAMRNDAGTPYFDFNSTVGVSTGAWFNYKLVVSGTTVSQYINNVLRGSTTFSGTRQQSFTVAQVGTLLPNNPGAERFYAGYIDNLLITTP